MKLERLATAPSSSGAGRSDSVVDQALLQQRLALLSGMSFAILASFYVVGQLMIALGEESYWPPSAHAIYGAAVLVTVATWLYCRAGARPLGRLRALDAVFTFVLASFMLFMPESTIPEKQVRMMVILQAVSLSLFIRSIFLPSTARRTFGVSVLAATPLAVYSLLTETARFSTWKIMWLAAAIAVATAGSGVIWGLRRDVRRARRLGQYTLEEKLGEGGMGLVYRARHAMLRRPTAVKLLRPDRVGESSLRRFEREVQLTAGLSHPNTVSVYDFGRTADGVFYYAMEYLDGLDLDQLVGSDGPQPPGRVVHVLRQVLGALAEAHAVGLVHRDIKPSNIILCERGGILDVAKVVDFGLARDPETADELSREGAIIGTPLYLAPEAIRSPQIDGRSDLYSLGAVAFKLLTAEPVFEGRSVVEVCGHHLHTPPEPPSKRLSRPLPPELDEWVLTCLQKEPARRFESAAAASLALERCPVDDPWTPERAREWWARRPGAPRRPHAPVEEGGTATMEIPLNRALGWLAAASSSVLLVSCTAAEVPRRASDADAARPPNLIYVMADDLGWRDLGSYGQERISTPRLDRMASEGLRFTQYYAGSTVCAPSRASLMTGLHTGHAWIRGNGEFPLRPEDVTVAEVLKAAGYRTGMVGKWGLGLEDNDGRPDRQGFDFSYGILHHVHAHRQYTDHLFRNGERVDVSTESYVNDLFTERALDFVRTSRDQPFFLYLAYTAPHAELRVPDESMAEYRGRFPEAAYVNEKADATFPAKPPWKWAGYRSQSEPRAAFAGMVTRLDRDVGRLLDLLAELGIDDDTIVFFTSDNGPHEEGGHDPHFFPSAEPLRGIKRDLYEGGIRVPMIVRGPGRVPARRTSDAVWAHWDVLPTLAELAGGPLPAGIDGASQRSVILGGSSTGEHAPLYWEFHERGFEQAVRIGTWKAVRHAPERPLEIYDLEADRSETKDVAADHPDVVARVEAFLASARTDSARWPIEPSDRR